MSDRDPLPLRQQMEAVRPGEILWQYLEQGPRLWRIRISRRRLLAPAQPAVMEPR